MPKDPMDKYLPPVLPQGERVRSFPQSSDPQGGARGIPVPVEPIRREAPQKLDIPNPAPINPSRK